MGTVRYRAENLDEVQRTGAAGGAGMKTYRVWVCLECEYDDIEADSEEEAFEIASDAAMNGGSWDWRVEEVQDA